MLNDDTPMPAWMPRVSLDDFHYDLPADRIAERPLDVRDASRLLVCDAVAGTIEHRTFRDVTRLIPSDALLVLNTTRVVRARVVMYRESGGRIEIVLLEPEGDGVDPAIVLASGPPVRWRCMVGGMRRFVADGRAAGSYGDETSTFQVVARLVERRADEVVVEFDWTPADASFAEVLDVAGAVPLPPYIKRAADAEDAVSYQTVYADQAGAVAAPTAGLHMTAEVLADLAARGVRTADVALHVGAGTFRQVKGDVFAHRMHEERIIVGEASLGALIDQARRREASPGAAPFVVVGTTSMRTLESLYWFGVRLAFDGAGDDAELSVGQWDPYRLAASVEVLPSLSEALTFVERWRAAQGAPSVTGHTGIMIVPGYVPRACDALITNFHQPGSTLILLVGALLGRDLWRRVYTEALGSGYRFLSYGDSSMLMLNPRRMPQEL